MAVQYHSRKLSLTENAIDSARFLPRMPASERRRRKIEKAIQSREEIAHPKQSPSLKSAIRNQKIREATLASRLQEIDEQLESIRIARLERFAANGARWNDSDREKEWDEILELDQSYRSLVEIRISLETRLEDARRNLRSLRLIEERAIQDYLTISSRRTAVKVTVS